MKQKETFNEKLSAMQLPRLPQVLIKLIDICRADEVDIRLVARTVAQDIAITSKTLQLANSAFLGARSQFNTIDQAVIYLGGDTVRNLAISVSVHEVFGKGILADNVHFDSEQFWYHSIFTALISKSIAETSGYSNPGAAYLTGLLHDTGKYLFYQHFGETYQELIDKQDNAANIAAAEQDIFGISHCDAGKRLLDSWNMSEEFGVAVSSHHNLDSEDPAISTLGRILRLANTLTVNSDDLSEQSIKDASVLQISPSVLPAIVAEQREALEDVALTLGIKITEPESYEHVLERENIQQDLSYKVERRVQLYGFMDNIIQAQSINRVFLALEESVSLLFNCKESVLLLPDHLSGNLVPQGSFRNRVAEKLKEQKFSLSIDASKNYLLNTTKKSLVVARKKDEPFLGPFFETTKRDFLLVVPLRISAKHQGLILLGLPTENAAITDEEETLQLISSHVGNRLYQELLKEEYATAFAKERITAVEMMARSIAHEMANPLGIIQNYLSLLSENSEQSPDISKDLSIIRNEIERIAHISEQLNDMSIPAQSSKKASIDVHELIAETVALYQKSIPSQTNITIHFIPAPDMPHVWIEAHFLKQILGNLITNSIEALEEHGVIEIHTHYVPETSPAAPGEIIITVSDDGPGVPPSIVNTIFRAGKTTKAKGHAGLGLAIVNKLTKDLSGRIYHSTGKQGKTQFTLHLPLLNQATRVDRNVQDV